MLVVTGLVMFRLPVRFKVLVVTGLVKVWLSVRLVMLVVIS